MLPFLPALLLASLLRFQQVTLFLPAWHQRLRFPGTGLSSLLQAPPHPCAVTVVPVAWLYGELVQGDGKAVAGLSQWAVMQTAHTALLADCWG